MAFDIGSLGGGGVAGIFFGILTVLGLKSKVDKMEEKKQDRSVCEVIHKSIDDKFTILINEQRKLFEKVDDINDYLRNQK